MYKWPVVSSGVCLLAFPPLVFFPLYSVTATVLGRIRMQQPNSEEEGPGFGGESCVPLEPFHAKLLAQRRNYRNV